MKEYRPSNERNSENQGDNRVIRKKKYKNHWAKALMWTFVILGFSIFLAFFALASVSDLLGLEQPDKQIEVVVKDGMGLTQITSLLSNKDVISQPVTFSLYARLKGSSSELNAGTYILNSNMSYDQILVALSTEKNSKETVQVTFYEGMTIREIAERLEEKKVCDSKEFLKAINDGKFEYNFISRIPENPNRFRKLEGYLFPDTYEFYVGMKPESVIKKFLTNFDNKLTEELDSKIKNSGMSLDEVITLASIIQEEASAKEEMGNVSSVFRNRLDAQNDFPKLQSDVTIFYVEKDIKPYQDKQNQALYDAYNTYVCDGLPVAPISNPGLDAINAVLEPSETDYYFFLTDVNGKYYYAKTANEHYNNDYVASKLGKTHGVSIK
ncbi:MAG: endolytic transglycosylase MltG [Oscillospiraceae bacterium]